MLKKILILTCFLMFISVAAVNANVNEDVGEQTFEETKNSLLESVEEYLNTRLRSADSSFKNSVLNYLDAHLSNEDFRDNIQANPIFMRVMGLLGSMGRAASIGEMEGYSDIIKDYYNLSDSSQQRVISELTLAFQSVNLAVDFDGSIFSVKDNSGGSIGSITFVANNPNKVEEIETVPELEVVEEAEIPVQVENDTTPELEPVTQQEEIIEIIENTEDNEIEDSIQDDVVDIEEHEHVEEAVGENIEDDIEETQEEEIEIIEEENNDTAENVIEPLSIDTAQEENQTNERNNNSSGGIALIVVVIAVVSGAGYFAYKKIGKR